MDQEYNTVKKTVLTQIKLTLFDEKKTLRLMIDGASTEGVGFVLFQWVNRMDPVKGAGIVNANYSRFKESQLCFSPIKVEATALDFSISCCSYWIEYCPQEELYSNCSGLLNLLNKSLCDIENKRLQKILARNRILPLTLTKYQE